MSLAEAAEIVGVSAPAMLSLVAGRRRRMGVDTAAGLWRLFAALKRRALRSRSSVTDASEAESVAALRRQVRRHSFNGFTARQRIELIEWLLVLHAALTDCLQFPTPRGRSQALRRKAS